jgi:predicted  nucleic acid-binding Zn-ribbon protein
VSQLLPLVEQLKNLEHLQELDLKIDSLKKGQGSLPANLRLIDEALNKLKVSSDSKKNTISELEKAHRQTQAAMELNRERLTRSNSKMEAVHNSQEFQAASKEIEQLKKLNITLEEQDKKSTLELEAIQKELVSIGEQHDKLQADRKAQAAVLSGQENKFNNDIASLTTERTQYSTGVDPRTLAQYNRVRSQRAGIGIVPAIGGRCKGCNMMVPPQLYNELHRGTALHNCPSCHRILYVPSTGAAEKAPEAKVTGS